MSAVDPNGGGALVIPGPPLPLASGADEIPVSTGAGRVYTAQALSTLVATLLGGGWPWDVAALPETFDTADATPTTAITLNASTWTHARVHVSATAAIDDQTNGCAWDAFVHVLNNGGTVTVSDVQSRRTNSVAPVDAWEVSFAVSGTNVLVQITGQAGTNINWTVSATVLLGT